VASASAIIPTARASYSYLTKLPGNVNMITIILWFYLIFFEKHVRDEALQIAFDLPGAQKPRVFILFAIEIGIEIDFFI
jgi:hypothetical protein